MGFRTCDVGGDSEQLHGERLQIGILTLWVQKLSLDFRDSGACCSDTHASTDTSLSGCRSGGLNPERVFFLCDQHHQFLG